MAGVVVILGTLAIPALSLDQLSAQGQTLSTSTGNAVSGIQDGIGQLADGAAQVSDNSADLRSGGHQLQAGTATLAEG